MFEFDLLWLLMAFCGGVFGAATGALPSFVFCGFGAVLGATVSIATKGEITWIDTWVTWGPLIGPQTAFAGGVVAAAYAKSKGKLANGRDICTPLMGLDSPDILIVGGIFGMVGALLTLAFYKIPNIGGQASTNSIACAIVATMMIGRLMFGKTGLFGKVRAGDNRWVTTDAGCWIPWQHRSAQILLIAVGVGVPASYMGVILPESKLMIFGVGCIIFAFLIYGTKVPVFHHIALAALFGSTATSNMWWGVTMAILVAFLCELAAFAFVAHADSHIDPPTIALAATGTIQPILVATGIMRLGPVAINKWEASAAELAAHAQLVEAASKNSTVPLIALAIVAIGFPLLMSFLRRTKRVEESGVNAMEMAS